MGYPALTHTRIPIREEKTMQPIKRNGLVFLLLVLFLNLCVSVSGVEITDVTWEAGVIAVELDSWPNVWGGWTMRINGQIVPMEGGRAGLITVRPNAPLNAPPTGLFIGTLPWLTDLKNVDFPCCGSIQFEIPVVGKTNEFEYNLEFLGCQTASGTKCPSVWDHHSGDLILSGSDVMRLDKVKYFQEGHIYIRDQAKLIIKDSEMMIGRGNVPTLHVYFFLDPGATLEISNSSIYKHPHTDTHVCTMNEGSVSIIDSTASIHYFDNFDSASLNIVNSTMVTAIGGILQVGGRNIHVKGSTIGAIGLRVPANATLGATGLMSGQYFQLWDVHDIIPTADYDLVLEETQILKDDLIDGPYERGWIIFADPDAHIRLKDCELRKVFFDLKQTSAEFEDLKIGSPCSMTYRDIVLENVTMRGQWPFSLDNATAVFRNCDNLFLQPTSQSTLTLIDSSISEFIPRDFIGTIHFENSLWDAAGEILGNVPYHSNMNNFAMNGSLTLAKELKNNLQFKDAHVSREYDILVRDKNGQPVQGAEVSFDGTIYKTDSSGHAVFSVLWDGNTYALPREMKTSFASTSPVTTAIDFFTNTPVIVDIDATVSTIELWDEIGQRE